MKDPLKGRPQSQWVCPIRRGKLKQRDGENGRVLRFHTCSPRILLQGNILYITDQGHITPMYLPHMERHFIITETLISNTPCKGRFLLLENLDSLLTTI